MLPASSADKERLRTLVGLDKRPLNSQFRPSVQKDGSLRKDMNLPDPAELLSLLQKHDQIVTELYTELETCKTDLHLVKEQSAAQFEQNRRVFDELRAQIVKNNLGKDTLPSASGQNVPGTVSVLRYPHQMCSNCRELYEYASKLERDKQRLQSRMMDCETEMGQLRRQDVEYLRKVRESVSLVDKAVRERNEVLVQLKHAQNRMESLENELKDCNVDHQKSLDQYRKSTQLRYETEIETVKSQLNLVTQSESETKARLNSVTQERDDLVEERRLAKQKSSEKRKEIDEQLKRLKEENARLSRTNKEMKETYGEKEKWWKLKELELSERTENTQRRLMEFKTSLDSGKSTWTVTKKENSDLKERLAGAEKEVWELRQWKQRLEKQLDQTVKNKDTQLKEAVRIAELKHDQTKMELERLLTNQNGLIFKLKEECKLLTDQLERVAKQRRSTLRPMEEPSGVYVDRGEIDHR